jgi:hypothetical protein
MCNYLTEEVKALKIKMADERFLRKKMINEIATKTGLEHSLITDFVENDPKAYKLMAFQNKCLEQVLTARNY